MYSSLILSIIASSAPALVATKSTHVNSGGSKSSIQTGFDVSWPQCNKSLPKNPLFGIVGVNDGLANNTNPCFATEFAWANASSGTTAQPKVALYVNTANPGNLNVADWPKSGTNVYGTCSGGDTTACAYQYGLNMAQADIGRIGTVNPAGYSWWLDVETQNSWETNTVNNVADLEGMTAYFESIGTSVGLYSTAYQWNQIVGNSVSTGSNLNGLNSWLPGASNYSGAQSNCKLPGLTTSSKATVAQYVARQTDYDVSCI